MADDQHAAFDRLVRARQRASEFLAENPSYEVATFTDNTLLRWRETAPDGGINPTLAWLPEELAAFQLAFSVEGILIRGAVETGLLAFTPDMVFGDALNHAYESETRSAYWPRIILSAKAVSAVVSAVAVADDTPDDVLASLLRDEDGTTFVHYLPWAGRSDAPEFFVERHRDSLLERLALERANPAVVEKIRWAIDYHNYAAIEMELPSALHIPVDAYARQFRVI